MWVGNDSANRWVFKCLRKTPSVPAEVMFLFVASGTLFHTAGPATTRARVPTVDKKTADALDKLSLHKHPMRSKMRSDNSFRLSPTGWLKFESVVAIGYALTHVLSHAVLLDRRCHCKGGPFPSLCLSSVCRVIVAKRCEMGL